MNNLQKIADFLRGSVFYVATVDENGKPKIRPFGAIGVINEKLYICTNSSKDVSRQMKAKSDIQIATTNADGVWLRLSANAILDNNQSAKEMMFEQNPQLTNIYADKMECSRCLALKILRRALLI